MHKRNESQYKPQVSEHLLHLKKIHQHNENHTETQLLRQQKIKKHLFLTSLQEKMEKLNSCQIPCRSYKKKVHLKTLKYVPHVKQFTKKLSSRRKASRLEEAFQFQCCLFESTFASLRENLIFEVLATKI